MKRWKQTASLVLAGALALALTACGGPSDPDRTQRTPEEVLAQTLENSQTPLESLSATAAVQVDLEVQADGQTQTTQTTTSADMVYFSDPFKLRAETSTDMGELGSFSATVYAQQEGDGYTMYTDVGGQWFRETTSLELLEQYNASTEMNTYLNSTQEWTFQQEEELDGEGNTLKFSGTVTGSQISALMEERGVLDSLGTLQQLGVSAENLQGILQDLGSLTIQMWVDPEVCRPVRYEMDMTELSNTLMERLLSTLAGMGEPVGDVSIRYPQVLVTVTCSDFNAAPDFEIPAEALES